MAYLWADGFDAYSGTGDLAERWDTVATGAITLSSAANTAFGVGGALSLANNATTTAQLTKTFATNEATIFCSLRTKRGAGSLASNYLWITFYDGTTAQVTVRFNEDGSQDFYRGTSLGTFLGNSPAGTAPGASWDSWQFKITISPTVGTCEMRKNGSTTAVINLTGQNTRASANSYVNKVSIGTNISLSAQIDDLFICSGSGAAPNDWPGDLRAITQAPSATVQQQFSTSPAAATWGQLSTGTSTNTGPGANVIGWYKTTAPYTGTCSTIALSLAAGITGALNVALYADSAGAPGAIMAQGVSVTNPSTGVNTFTLGTQATAGATPSPQGVVENTAYWIAVWSSAAAASGTFNGVGGTFTRTTLAATYGASFPTAYVGGGTASTSVNSLYYSANLTSIDNASLVNDSTQDADSTYVFSSTVGAEDLYSFASLASLGIAPAAVTGVIPFVIARKSDSGARTISVQAKSGATEVAAASNAAPGLTYQFLGGWLATDPATGAAWTTAAVDALQIGPKVVA